jgi:hypothetical protein
LWSMILLPLKKRPSFWRFKEPMSTTLTLLKIRFARAKLVLSSKIRC